MSKSTHLTHKRRVINLPDVKENILPTDDFWGVVGKITSVNATVNTSYADGIYATNKLAYIMYQRKFEIPNEDVLIERLLGAITHAFLRIGYYLVSDDGRDHVAAQIAAFNEKSLIQTSNGKHMSARITSYSASSKMGTPDDVYTTMQLIWAQDGYLFTPKDRARLDSLILSINPYEALCKVMSFLYELTPKKVYMDYEYKQIIRLLSFGTSILCHLCHKLHVDPKEALRGVYNASGSYSAFHGIRSQLDFKNLNRL